MKWSFGLFLVSLVLFFILANQHFTQQQTFVQAQQVAGASIEDTPPLQADILSLINVERVSRGLQPLIIEPATQIVAEARAQDMSERRYYAHRDPDGKLFYDYSGATHLEKADFSCENLVLLTTINPKEVVTEWLASTDGHRECLLHKDIAYAGVSQASIDFSSTDQTQSYISVFLARTAR
jgi:uncharacterized protein YkwD